MIPATPTRWHPRLAYKRHRIEISSLPPQFIRSSPHLVGLLCTRRNRPCCRAAYQRDELSPSHVPTGPKTAHRIGSNAALIGVETSLSAPPWGDVRKGSIAPLSRYRAKSGWRV